MKKIYSLGYFICLLFFIFSLNIISAHAENSEIINDNISDNNLDRLDEINSNDELSPIDILSINETSSDDEITPDYDNSPSDNEVVNDLISLEQNAGWNQNKNGYWYQNSDGSYPQNQWKQISNYWYHFNDKGYMDCNKWIGYYYVKSDGKMAKSEWVDNDKFYVDANGKWVEGKVKIIAGWKSNTLGTWYQNSDGSYPKQQWKLIDNKWYYFNANGYLDKNKWVGGCYVDANGVMVTSSWVDNNLYYVNSNGYYVNNCWLMINDNYYHFNRYGLVDKNKWIGDCYVDENGVMVTNSWVDNNLYYVNSNGYYVNNCWLMINDNYYHFNRYGLVDKNKWIGSYYVDENGVMVTSSWVDNNHYYVDENGSYVYNCWFKINSNYYHFNKYGLVDRNKWIGSSYVDENGVMVTSSWVDNNHYYVDENGNYVYNCWFKINSNYYHFNKYGLMDKSKWINDRYVKYDGKMAKSEWIGNYYVKSNGNMARSEWVDNDKFYVDENGLWVQGKFNLNYIPKPNYNDIVRSIQRTGDGMSYPHHSLNAFKEAYNNGFRIFLCDLIFTSDDIGVCFHDSYLNEYYKDVYNNNGNLVSTARPIYISKNTYDTLNQYDYGRYKGTDYIGYDLLKFEDMLKLSRQLNVELYVEVKGMNEQQAKIACDLVTEYGLSSRVSWCGTPEQMHFIIDNIDTARVSIMPEAITNSVIREINELKTGKNKVFIFGWETTPLTKDIVDKLNANDIAFEMGTLSTEQEIIDYYNKGSAYYYCTGIESANVIAGKVLFENALN